MMSGKHKQKVVPKPDEYDRVDDPQPDKPGIIACIKFATTPDKVNQWHTALEEYCRLNNIKGTTEAYIATGFTQGKQLKILKGKFANVTVNIYTTGTITIQGKMNAAFADSEYPKLRSIANSEKCQPVNNTASVPSEGSSSSVTESPLTVSISGDAETIDDDITLEKEKFKSQSLNSPNGVKELPSSASKIPIATGSPMKVSSSLNEKLMLDILERLERSQVAITSNLGEMSQEINKMSNSVSNIDNRLCKLEKSIKPDSPNSSVEEIKNDVQSVERLINNVITNVNVIRQDVKDLPSVHDIGALIPPKPNLDEVSSGVRNIDACLKNDISDKLDHVVRNLDEIKSKPIGASGGRTDVYICKGEGDPFSNLWRCKVCYNEVEYASAEHAIQITRALHVFGGETDNDIIKQIWDTESPKQVKLFADKNIPYSSSWQKKKVKVQGDIFTAKFDQNPDIDKRLKETGDMKIRHPVASKYWGTGRYGRGKNIFGKWIEARRAGKPLSSVEDESDLEEDSDVDSISSENDGSWNTVGRPIKFRSNTETVIIGDSVTEQIDPEMFGKGIEKLKTLTIDDFERTVEKIVPNERIKHSYVHVGINNVIDRQDNVILESREEAREIAKRLTDAMSALQSKLPNAQILYSEAIDRDECILVEEFNYHVEVFINRHKDKFDYIAHSIKDNFFENRKHLSDAGNRIFIKPMKDKLRGYQNHGSSQYYGANQNHEINQNQGRWRGRSQSQDRRGRSHDGRGRSHDGRGRPHDGRGRPHDGRGRPHDGPNTRGPYDYRSTSSRRGYQR